MHNWELGSGSGLADRANEGSEPSGRSIHQRDARTYPKRVMRNSFYLVMRLFFPAAIV